MSHNKLKRLFLPFISCLTYKSLVDRNIIYTFASNNDKKNKYNVCSYFSRYSFFYIFMY